MSLYKDQIFVLLGHNGAGKTTLINIITGMTKCDSGQILFENQNLLKNKKFLFKNIGLCSQENIFYEELTVIENLQIMQEIKGNIVDNTEINDLLIKLDLVDKKDCLSDSLSGGQKRKLCIALALIANSKLILLDEPTSGMDVTAKRHLWTFIKNYKKDKIIILTTHSLDEADYLADRLGIISEGRLVCTGTSSFLKHKYSCGFNINILLNNEQNLDRNIINDDKIKIIHEMKKIDPKLYVKVISKESIVLNFPEITENCDKIFSRIDEIKEEFKIMNYTLSTTSLEDVFLKVNNNDFSKNLFEDQINNYEANVNSTNNSLSVNQIVINDNNLNESKSVILNEIKLNIVRHLISNYRNKKNILLEMTASLLTFFVSLLSASVFFYSTKSIEFSRLLSKTDIHISMNPSISSFLINDLESRFPYITTMTKSNFTSISEFDNYLFDNNPYHNNKGSILIDSFSKEKAKLSIVYQSISIDYGISVQNVILSVYLKKYFNISTKLIVKITK